MQPDVERFLALVCRELGAEEAHIREPGDPREANGPASESADPCELRWAMPDGRTVVVRFALEPVDREVRQRRLEMLAGTFDTVWDKGADKGAEDGRSPRSRPPVARSLREELQALCERAGAVNAVVVDANSPIVWGAAHPDGLTEDAPRPVTKPVMAPPMTPVETADRTAMPVAPVTTIRSGLSVAPTPPVSSASPVGANDVDPADANDGEDMGASGVEALDPTAADDVDAMGASGVEALDANGANDVGPVGANDVELAGSASTAARAAAASRIAMRVVRTMNDGAASRKGKHVRHIERNGDAPFVAHSFAGIYLLVIVYEGLFDELRAERAIVEALPRIERLVMALPPLDPTPTKGASVVSMRRRS